MCVLGVSLSALTLNLHAFCRRARSEYVSIYQPLTAGYNYLSIVVKSPLRALVVVLCSVIKQSVRWIAQGNYRDRVMEL